MKTIIKVDGMSCSHCANKVKENLESIELVKKVTIDLNKKEVTIFSTNTLDEKIIKEKIENLDYKYLGIVNI